MFKLFTAIEIAIEIACGFEDNKEYLLEDDIEALAYIQMTWVKGWVSNHVLYNI